MWTSEQREWLLQFPISDLFPNRLRLAIGMSRENVSMLSRRTGVSRATIHEHMAGLRKRVRIDTAKRLADAYGLTLEEMFPTILLSEEERAHYDYPETK